MFKVLLLVALLFLLPTVALANDFHRHPSHFSRGRVDVYNYDGNRRSAPHHTGPDFGTDGPDTSCFPNRCGGLGPTLRNSDPDARKPENLTICLYGVTDSLQYVREGKICPYKYVDENQFRIERSRLEWLRQQKK